MRYISTPQRSHSILSSDGAAVLMGVMGRVFGGVDSDMDAIMA
jgi:hypothetical protein